jgi:hypothetical protein
MTESRAQRAARRNNNAAVAAGAAASAGGNIKKEDEREVKQEERSSRRRDKRSVAGGGSSKHKRKGGPSNNNRDNLNNNGGGGGGGDEAQQPPTQNDVLTAFYNMLQQGAPQQAGLGAGGELEHEDIHIDLEIASNVLEAAAGNLSLAMNLYWDNYFASQANNNNNNQEADNNNHADDARLNDEGLDRKPAARGQHSSQRHGHHDDDDDNDENESGDDDDDDDDDDVKETLPNQRRRSSRNSSSSKKNLKRSNLEAHLEASLEDDSSPQPKRRLRRSLDSDFRAAEKKDEKKKKKKKNRKNNSKNNDDSNNESNNDDDEKMPAIDRNNEGNDQDDDGDNPDGPNENNDNDNNDNDIEELVENEVAAAHRRAARRNRPRRGRGEPLRGVIVLDGEAEASISVSDDELGEVKRKQTRRRGNPPRRPKPPLKMDTGRRAAVLKAAESISRKVAPNQFNKKIFLSPEQVQRKERRHRSGDSNDSEDPGDYISDSDWLEVDLKPSLSSESLWGTFTPLPPPLPPGEENNNNDDNNNNDNNNYNNNEGGNVVAEDDDEVQIVAGEEKDTDNNASPSSGSAAADVQIDVSSAVVGIPHTWLNCGFELSDCGSGLVIKSPNVEDIEFFTWRQQQAGGNRNAVPPPYHCKTLTAIISSVTALLYTGVSIQGDEVNCTSGKKPWASLTAEERKREFESRLVDALSSLIFVAARASLKRKQKAYCKTIRAYDNMDNINTNTKEQKQATEELKQNKKSEISDGSDNGNNNNGTDEPFSSNDKTTNSEKKATLKNKKEQMRRRLDLIPTCVWDDEKVAILSRTAEGPMYNSDVKVKTSWTNIRDIKLYVRSNMRAFAAKGGVALLLETITKIHGNKAIARQLKQLSVKAEPKEIWGERTSSSSNKSISSLIRCTCEERQKKIYEEKPLPLNIRIDPRKLLDTTPPGNECASVQLLTLILTGRAHSNWSNCSTEGLGFGFLTEHTGEVGHSLARPKNPVWLLRGDTCYSVLSFEGRWGCKFGGQLPDLETVSKVDQPGMSVDFRHWNGWYGQRGKSGMRLITSKEKNQIPSKELLSRFSDHHHRQGTENTKSLLMERRRRENLVKTVSAEEHKSNEIRERENRIRPLEVERIKIHPDDQKFYPKKHALWRYEIGNNEDENTPLEDRKMQAENWIPYYRLTSRQKKIVEIKLGPKINTILWTRWPDAKIDNFTPKDGTFPVV